MIHDIISKLITFRKDFLLFMQIYIISIDETKAEALRNHFILNEKKMKKIENGDTNGDAFIKFAVSFSCLFDEESYYKKFVQGILLYLRAAFKENYLFEYIEKDFYQFLDKSKYYKENSSSLIYSLNNMLVDINRVISENSQKEINKYSEKDENKISNQKFGTFFIQSNLHKNKEKNEVKSIYEKCKNNDEILKEIDKFLESSTPGLEDEFYENLVIFKGKIEEFIEKGKKKVEIEKLIAENSAQIYYSRKQIRDLEKANSEFKEIKEEFGKLKNDNNNLSQKIEALNTKNKELERKNGEFAKKIGDLEIKNGQLETKNGEFAKKIGDLETKNGQLETKIGELETKNGQLENEIKNLKIKVDFMEPIVLSLISRKVINYSMIKILQNYKKDIKISSIGQNNNKIYKITFNNSVNKISKEELNNLLDNLFNKKDDFNQDSHLVNKNVQSFIPDIWDQVKKHLKLNKNEIIAFDAIITDDIKSGFNFGDDDISVKNYLDNEFGN